MSSELVNTQTTVQKAPEAGPSKPLGEAKRFLRGDLGQIPVIATLIVIAVFFEITTQGLFLKPRNLSELVLQIATIAMLALGSVFVLLIGEIDLSLAAVSYLCGTITVVLSVRHGYSPWMAMVGGVVAGAVIGLVNGFFVAIVRVPSFIVTLAGSIGYAGLVLHILLPNTSISLSDPTLLAIAANYMPDYLGIGLPLIALAIYLFYIFSNRFARQRNGLTLPPIWVDVLRAVVAAVVVIGAVVLFESYLGVPIATAIVVFFLLLSWIVVRFTAYGRHIYAVGGNAEAARRAGISVTGIRVSIFVIAAVFAAIGGIILSSRQAVGSAEIDQSLLLNSIAAAVIGGVSLFGGRGSVWAVVLGSLIIGSLDNGLVLLNQGTDVRYMVEGIVLVFAVTVDAFIRRRSAVQGR